MAEIRAKKHWSLRGEANGMHGRTGDKNPRWKGGISPERQSLYSSSLWAEIIIKVWDRDDSKCQKCGHEETETQKLHIHHIAPFTVKELRTDLDNLILLCSTCHGWVHSKNNTAKEYINDHQ